MRVELIHTLGQVSAEQWNGLEGGIDNPFLRHEFLSGLEEHGCVGEKWGWLGQHLIVVEGGRLLGALPLYRKENSYGELVFDWSWADAYQRAGLSYYPKLVSAVPYSPVTGPRLLAVAGARRLEIKELLAQKALELSRGGDDSSLHILFSDAEDTALLERQGLLRRTGSQFHWFNRGYRDFDDYLATFSAKKRKNLKRERRRVAEQGIEILQFDGHSAGAPEWAAFNRFYLATFDKHWGYATLNEGFFHHLGTSLPDSVVLLLARHQGEYVAGALSLRSADTLYGRHWGSTADYHSLHFELCYYQGLEYCIRHGLKRFEPGAQGEHKVGRGFEPVPTWSAHHLNHPQFQQAIARYLAQEHEAMESYMAELRERLPFKERTQP